LLSLTQPTTAADQTILLRQIAWLSYQRGNIVIEADVSGTTLRGSSGPVIAATLPPGGICIARTDLITDVTGTLGYGVGAWLIYSKGGAAWSRSGVEYAFWQRWSAKLEYEYYNFNVSGTLTNPVGVTQTGSYTQYAHTFKLGLNWHFWTGGALMRTPY
jgi:outer membrane immunogenic protein